MKKVIEHLEGLNARLDDALREMQGPAIWNDLANRAERNSGEYNADGSCKMNQLFYKGARAYCAICGLDWNQHVCTQGCGRLRSERSSFCDECTG